MNNRWSVKMISSKIRWRSLNECSLFFFFFLKKLMGEQFLCGVSADVSDDWSSEIEEQTDEKGAKFFEHALGI